MSNPEPDYVRRAVERARWLGELAVAVDKAGSIAPPLAAARLDPAELRSLELRLTALQSEIDAIRKGRPPAAEEIDRFWM